VIEAPRIARKHQAGQFVILWLHEQRERIPLTMLNPEHAHPLHTRPTSWVCRTRAISIAIPITISYLVWIRY